jgi:glucose-1-phosphate thymidylyltransferase
MKGIILAGGTGSRLYPLTKVTNKHLLPVYDKPMIYYPLQTLVAAGIKDIMIVSGRGHVGHFLELLGSGKDLGVRLTYEIQEGAGGIAQALGLAEEWAGTGQRRGGPRRQHLPGRYQKGRRIVRVRGEDLLEGGH